MICPHCGKFIDSDRKQAYSNNNDKKYIEMTFEVSKETEKAIGVNWFGEKIWMPKSQLKNLDDSPVGGYDDGETITIKVSEWIAKEKGFITEPATPDTDREKAEQKLRDRAAKNEQETDIPF